MNFKHRKALPDLQKTPSEGLDLRFGPDCQAFKIFVASLLLALIITSMAYMYKSSFHDASGVYEAPSVLSKITYLSASPQLVEEFRRLNKLLLPINYSDNIYRKIQEFPQFSKLALLNETVSVGSLTSREEDPAVTGVSFLSQKTADVVEKHVYIMTIGVLPLYRRYGIGSQLLKELEAEVRKLNALSSLVVYSALILHVQYNNTAAMEFYKHNGFVVLRDIPAYYTTIQPRGAYLLVKTIVD